MTDSSPMRDLISDTALRTRALLQPVISIISSTVIPFGRLINSYWIRLFFLSDKAAQRWKKKQGYFKWCSSEYPKPEINPMRCKKLEMVSSAFKRQSKIRSGTGSTRKDKCWNHYAQSTARHPKTWSSWKAAQRAACARSQCGTVAQSPKPHLTKTSPTPCTAFCQRS